MPEDVEILPVPDKLAVVAGGCTVAGVQQGVNQNNGSEPAEGAAKKEFSLTPSRNGATVQPWDPVSEIEKRREASEREVFSI